MKLLLCKECQDIVRLIDVKRTCKCGKVGGKYTDDLSAIYFGEMAVPIGFANSTLVKAVHKQPNENIYIKNRARNNNKIAGFRVVAFSGYNPVEVKACSLSIALTKQGNIKVVEFDHL